MRSQSQSKLQPVKISTRIVKGVSAESDQSSDEEPSREYIQDSNHIPSKALRLLGLSSSQPSPKHHNEEGHLPYLTTSDFAHENDYTGIYRTISGNLTPTIQTKDQHQLSPSSVPSTPILHHRPSRSSFFKRSSRPRSTSSASASFTGSQLSRDESEGSIWERSSSTRTPSLTSGSESGQQDWEDMRRHENFLPLRISTTGSSYGKDERTLELNSSSEYSPSIDSRSLGKNRRPKLSSRSRSSSSVSTSGISNQSLNSKPSISQRFFSYQSRASSSTTSGGKSQSKDLASGLLKDTDFTHPPLSAPPRLKSDQEEPTFSQDPDRSREGTDDETEVMAHDDASAFKERSRRSFGGKSSLTKLNDFNQPSDGLVKKNLEGEIEDQYWLNRVMNHPNLSFSQLQKQVYNSEGGSQNTSRTNLQIGTRYDRVKSEKIKGKRRGSTVSGGTSSEILQFQTRPSTAKGPDETSKASSSSSSVLLLSNDGEVGPKSRKIGNFRESSDFSFNPSEEWGDGSSTPTQRHNPALSPPIPRKSSSRRPKTSSGIVQTSEQDSSSRPITGRTASGTKMSVVGGTSNLFSSNLSESPFMISGAFSSYREIEEIPGFYSNVTHSIIANEGIIKNETQSSTETKKFSSGNGNGNGYGNGNGRRSRLLGGFQKFIS